MQRSNAALRKTIDGGLQRQLSTTAKVELSRKLSSEKKKALNRSSRKRPLQQTQ